MEKEKQLPRPSVETLNVFDTLKILSKDTLTLEEEEKVTTILNELLNSYDWSNYEFTDPETGMKGVKNPAGEVLVPAEYEDFSFVGDHDMFVLPHIAAKKNGKYGVVTTDGTGKVSCDFRFDLLVWDPFTSLFEAYWDGVKDKFGLVNKHGKVFIPNVLTRSYEPWNDFILLEGDGKFGALDARTFNFVLPEYDKVDTDDEEFVIFHKDGVAGYVNEETGEFVSKEQYDADEEKYGDAYYFNTFINI